MATEGEFPKDNGDILYASEVNSFGLTEKDGFLFKNLANLYWNASYIGFNSNLCGTGSPQLKDAQIFTTLPTVSITNESFMAGNGYYYSGVLYDSYNSSVDTNLWEETNGTITESDTSIGLTKTVGTNSQADSYIKAKGLNVKPATDTVVNLVLRYTASYSSNNGGSDGTFELQLHDGTNTVNVYSQAYVDSINRSVDNMVELLIVNTGGTITCTAYINGVAGSNIDVSTLTGSTWNIRNHVWFNNASGSQNGTSTLGFGYYYYANNITSISGTSEIVSTLTATTDTISNAIVTLINNSSSCGGTTTFLISADGTNYNTYNDLEPIEITNSGTSPKLKITFSGTPSRLLKIREGAIFYNPKRLN